MTQASLTALESVAGELRDSARTILAANFVGAYLVGSFALGAGDEHSDVDFIVVTADDIDSTASRWPGHLRWG